MTSAGEVIQGAVVCVDYHGIGTFTASAKGYVPATRFPVNLRVNGVQVAHLEGGLESSIDLLR